MHLFEHGNEYCFDSADNVLFCSGIRRETVSQSLPLVHAVADVLVTRVENSFNVLRSKVSLNMKDNPLYV